MDLGLADARVLVVGGSRGMGRAAAETFRARRCARVAVLARASEALDDTVATLRSEGSPESIPLAADLTNLIEVDSAIDRLGERWEALEVLVNTAGPVDVGIGPFDSTRRRPVAGHLRYRGAQRGSHGSPYPAPAPSRVVRQDRQHLGPLHQAAESGPRGVYRNQSCPEQPDEEPVPVAGTRRHPREHRLAWILPLGRVQGYLRSLPPERGVDSTSLTDAMRVIAEDFGHPAYLGRAGSPAEIGPVIAFLGSRVNSYMTGADVNVDGGSDFT